jgi:hypothetical protein
MKRMLALFHQRLCDDGRERRMNVFTTRNVVLLGLLQVGVIVFTVLAAGVSKKWQTTFKLHYSHPELLQIVFDYGWIALLIPAAWVVVAVVSLQNDDWPSETRAVALYGGFAVLLLLLAFSWTAVVRDWLGVLMHG